MNKVSCTISFASGLFSGFLSKQRTTSLLNASTRNFSSAVGVLALGDIRSGSGGPVVLDIWLKSETGLDKPNDFQGGVPINI